MKTLLRYIGDLKEYLVFSSLVIISLVLIFQNDNVQIKFMRGMAVSFIGVIQSGFSVIPNIFQLEKENKLLRNQH
jgi:hypothetical protein